MSGTAGSEPESNSEPAPEPKATSEPVPESESTSEPESESIPEIEPTPHSESESTSFLSEVEPHSEATPKSNPEWNPDAINSTLSIALPEISAEPQAEASPVEIVVPPAVFALFGCLVLLLLYLLSKKNKLCKRRKHAFYNKRLQEMHVFPSYISESETCKDIRFEEQFFSCCEIDALERNSYFENSAKGLVHISVPPLLALLFCPLTLLLYTPLANFLWPKQFFTEIPNINDALACFLVPAGMVYAITFGFAVQEVLQKHLHLQQRLSSEVQTSRDIACIINQIEELSTGGRQKIFRLLKTNIVNRLLQAQNKFESVENVNMWAIVEILKKESTKHSITTQTLLQVLFKNIDQLFQLIPDNGPLYEHINPIQWVLLETLSGFSFLGILLIKAQSYSLEVAMCLITVISITLLVFAVSDLDSPFDGFFRVDMLQLEDFVYELYKAYQQLAKPDIANVGHIKTDNLIAPFRTQNKYK